jgi:hypothetical protein
VGEGATIDKKGGDVVFPKAMVSVEVEEFGIGITFTVPPQAGLLHSDRALHRCEAKVAEFKKTPEGQLLRRKRPRLLSDL